MREFLEDQYGFRATRWDEPQDDGSSLYEGVLASGQLVRADSLALLISEVQAWESKPLVLNGGPAMTNVISWHLPRFFQAQAA